MIRDEKATGAGTRIESWLLRHETRILLLLLLVIGVFAKLAPMLLDPARRLLPTRSEMWRVAVHWAETGTLADAYYDGSGISSHVGPLNTILAGSVYRLFGIASPVSELLLSIISLTMIAVMIWFFHHAMRLVGVRVIPALAAAAVLAIGPLEYNLEGFDFRIREGGTVTMLMAILLFWLLQLDRTKQMSVRNLGLYGLLSGIAFLVNPVIALGAYAGLTLVGLRHMPVRRWPGAALLLLAALLLINAPWILRNEVVYGRFMPSRGNFGLELAIANYEGALQAPDRREAFQQRMKAVHPVLRQPDTIARYQSYAQDVEYFDALGAEARQWLRAHKEEFAQLTLRHLGELLFPPEWAYQKYEDGPIKFANRVRQRVASITAARLLCSIMQPTPRYRYVLVPAIMYLAAELLWRGVAVIWRQPLYGPQAAGPSRMNML